LCVDLYLLLCEVLVSPIAIQPLGPRNSATRRVICPRAAWTRPLPLDAHQVRVDASADTLRRLGKMLVRR
jgi:hypothetical protein